MSDHLTPLQVCESLIGPFPDLERIAEYRPKAAYAWRRPAPNRRAGWLPPAVNEKFLIHLEAKGYSRGQAAAWLILGASPEEIASARVHALAEKVAAE